MSNFNFYLDSIRVFNEEKEEKSERKMDSKKLKTNLRRYAIAFEGLAQIIDYIPGFNSEFNTDLGVNFKIGTYIPPNPGSYLRISNFNDKEEVINFKKMIDPIIKSNKYIKFAKGGDWFNVEIIISF